MAATGTGLLTGGREQESDWRRAESEHGLAALEPPDYIRWEPEEVAGAGEVEVEEESGRAAKRRAFHQPRPELWHLPSVHDAQPPLALRAEPEPRRRGARSGRGGVEMAALEPPDYIQWEKQGGQEEGVEDDDDDLHNEEDSCE
jgi:hypothetical protein